MTTATTSRGILMSGVAALALSATLGLGACKDKDAAAGGSEAVSALRIDGVSSGDIAARFEVAPRKVDAASADAALDAIGLLDESERLSWGSRDGADGTYTYTDVVLEDAEDGSRMTVKRLDLMGARMEGENALFDKIVVDDMAFSDDEGGTGSLDAATLINATINDLDEIADGVDPENFPEADAFAVEGLSFTSDDDDADMTFTLSNAAYAGQTASGAKDGFFTLSDMKLDGEMKENGTATPMRMSLDSITITDMTSFSELQTMSSGGASGLSGAVSNPYSLPFKQFALEDFDLFMDGFSMDVDGMQMTSDDRDGKLTVDSVMEPLTVKFASDPTMPEMVQFRDALSKLGYDEMVFTAKGQSVIDLDSDTALSKGGYFDMKDGFRMEIDQDMRGVGAMQTAQADALRAAGFETAPGPDADPDVQAAYNGAAMQATMAAIQELELGEFTLRLDDNSIMDRVFEMMAAEQETSPKMLRAQAKSMLAFATMAGSETGVDPAIIQSAVSALGEWIDNPGSTLVLSVDPEGYVPMMEVPGLDADAMGFTASVDK